MGVGGRRKRSREIWERTLNVLRGFPLSKNVRKVFDNHNDPVEV